MYMYMMYRLVPRLLTVHMDMYSLLCGSKIVYIHVHILPAQDGKLRNKASAHITCVICMYTYMYM